MGDGRTPRYWFYAKAYGWGWGLPACWQGWVVLFGYLVMLVGGAVLLTWCGQPGYFAFHLATVTVLLIAVCWWKGEPARWRWGEGTDAVTRPNTRALLLVHLVLGPLLLAGAILFRTHPPTQINAAYGHRTAASMRSQEAWDEAQRFSADAMIMAAAVTIVYQVISCFVMKPGISVGTSVAVLVLTLMAGIATTEMHLARHGMAAGPTTQPQGAGHRHPG